MQHAHKVLKIKKAKGIANGNGKLTEDQVVQIRQLRADKVPAKIIAVQFNVHPWTVYGIAQGVQRRNVII